MSQTTPALLADRRAPRLSTRARAGILGATSLTAVVAAGIVISGAAGASAVGEPRLPAPMVEAGSNASDETWTAPASMVEEGSGASDATDSVLPGQDTRTIDVLPGQDTRTIDVLPGEDTPSADAGR